MAIISFSARACLALLMLGALNNGFVSALEEQKLEHVMKLRQDKRSLDVKNHTEGFKDEASDAEFIETCSAQAPSMEQGIENMAFVESFFGNYSWSAEAQGPIAIDVNWVAVTSATTGAGFVSDGAIAAQIDHLNANYGPEFFFILTSIQRVANDQFFSIPDTIAEPSQAEIDMKFTFHQGDETTLNVYSLAPTSAAGTTGGWGTFPTVGMNHLDGVIINFQSLPGGGHSYWSHGDVCFKVLYSSLPSLLTHCSVCSILFSTRCLSMRLDIGLASTILSISNARGQVTSSQTLRRTRYQEMTKSIATTRVETPAQSQALTPSTTS
jgi:hypothetical protein